MSLGSSAAGSHVGKPFESSFCMTRATLSHQDSPPEISLSRSLRVGRNRFVFQCRLVHDETVLAPGCPHVDQDRFVFSLSRGEPVGQ